MSVQRDDLGVWDTTKEAAHLPAHYDASHHDDNGLKPLKLFSEVWHLFCSVLCSKGLTLSLASLKSK